eukprot:1262677-Rhodomonas_salina.1
MCSTVGTLGNEAGKTVRRVRVAHISRLRGGLDVVNHAGDEGLQTRLVFQRDIAQTDRLVPAVHHAIVQTKKRQA